ncbi:MAG: hypothetical protein LBS05_02020 [Tannerellaceae bacterium]|jgi:hypothetical protein|nr:hypothetical protein [Tannerellaceae bacterium]
MDVATACVNEKSKFPMLPQLVPAKNLNYGCRHKCANEKSKLSTPPQLAPTKNLNYRRRHNLRQRKI